MTAGGSYTQAPGPVLILGGFQERTSVHIMGPPFLTPKNMSTEISSVHKGSKYDFFYKRNEVAK